MCEFVDNGGSLFARDVVEAALEDGAGPGMEGEWRGTAFVAVDLGKTGDFTAIAILEREEQRLAWMPAHAGLRVRYLERMALGTPYTRVVKRIEEIVASLPAQARCRLVVDGTGVGAPVVDMLKASKITRGVTAISITGGARARSRADGWNVPRTDLITGVQVMLERGELKIPRKLKDAGALAKELIKMRLDDRGGEHDDLVLAVALGCWAAGRPENGYVGKRLSGI
jgi:hypothetical protein